MQNWSRAALASAIVVKLPSNGLLEMHFASWIQKLLFIVGVVMIGTYMAAYFHKEVLSRAQLRQFHRSPIEAPVETIEAPVETKETLLAAPASKPDFRFWSEKRIAEYEDSLTRYVDPPLALLHISKVQLEAPVLEGTDDLTLNRGVGHIVGTARPGEEGNIGIAGHRDGFFRALKDIRPGDTIELVTPLRTNKFTVDRIVLVRPDDVSVLRPRSVGSLTLVTCYPFYFIGSAPQRYIVQASLAESDRTESENHELTNSNN
jgi:sortase A